MSAAFIRLLGEFVVEAGLRKRRAKSSAEREAAGKLEHRLRRMQKREEANTVIRALTRPRKSSGPAA